MILSPNSIASLDSLEKAAAYLRSDGRKVELAIDADTGAIRMRVDGRDQAVGVLVVTNDDCPDAENTAETRH